MALRVLTVDDSKTIRMIVKKAFKPYDCELMEAENGVEGLSTATKEKPDLIILDITMPVMNGIEMLDKLKAESALKNIPVIMLTAESGKDNVMKIVKMGVKDYMVKPFKGEQLIDRVKSFLTLEEKKEGESDVNKIKKYFPADEDVQFLSIPAKLTRSVIVDIEGLVNPKLKEISKAGIKKFIINLIQVEQVNVSLIKLLILAAKVCKSLNIAYRIVCTDVLQNELKGFQETSAFPTHTSIEDAKANF